jgi:hypothetical protein
MSLEKRATQNCGLYDRIYHDERRSPMVKLGLGKRNITKDIPAKNQKQILSDEEFSKRVEAKAYELYQKRGYQHGSDFDDWLEAEQIVRDEIA